MATKTDSAWAEHALAALQEAGYRRGGARTAVVEALARHDCAVTALDLDDELRRRRPAVGRASVYRALEQLEQLGLVQRLEVTRGTAGYERVEPGGEHHHHAICRHCGRMVPFEDPLAGAGDRQALRARSASRSPTTTWSCAASASAARADFRRECRRVGDLVEIFLLSLLAMFNPTLLAAVTLMLLLPNPKRLMLGYLLGAYTASISVGLVIVFALPRLERDQHQQEHARARPRTSSSARCCCSSPWSSPPTATGPCASAGSGARTRSRRRATGEEKEPLPMRLLGRGSPRVAFVVGLLLVSFPGVSYLTGLNHIHKLDAGGGCRPRCWSIAFCLIQQLLLEVPLAGYFVAPEKTARDGQAASGPGSPATGVGRA